MANRKKLANEYRVDWSKYHAVAENVNREGVFFLRFDNFEILNFTYNSKKLWCLFFTHHIRQALHREGLNGEITVAADQEITFKPYTRTEEERHKWEEFNKSTDIFKFLETVKKRATKATDHFTKNLLDPLHRAMIRLMNESSIALIIAEAKETGVKLKSTAEIMQLIDDSLHAEAQLIRQRVSTPLGGSRKRRGKFESADDLMELVETIDCLRPLWDYVTDFFESNDYEAGCVEMLKKSSRFKVLSQNRPVPSDLLKVVYKRKSKSTPDLEPLTFAIKHTRRLFNLELKPNTIRQLYFKGKKLLRDKVEPIVE